MDAPAAPPRWLRVVAPVLRLPARFDRRGLRWALRLCSPVPILVLSHRGRRSGRCYRTPVELLSGSPAGEMFVLPFAGRRSDWLGNLMAGSPVQGSCRGHRGPLEWRFAGTAQATRALDDYRTRHPLYTRGLLAIITRVNDLPGGSPSEEIAARMPVVAFRFRGSS